jgi:hypothetical protein
MPGRQPLALSQLRLLGLDLLVGDVRRMGETNRHQDGVVVQVGGVVDEELAGGVEVVDVAIAVPVDLRGRRPAPTR